MPEGVGRGGGMLNFRIDRRINVLNAYWNKILTGII